MGQPTRRCVRNQVADDGKVDDVEESTQYFVNWLMFPRTSVLERYEQSALDLHIHARVNQTGRGVANDDFCVLVKYERRPEVRAEAERYEPSGSADRKT
jgi:hypothetical protein